jgi:formamidopyrimidine-DNA glycosylase
MVEGPQATHQANWVRRRFKNKKLDKVQIIKGRYKKSKPKNLFLFEQDLPLVLKDIVKKGKVLFLIFEKGWVVIVKFGMTAWLSAKEDEPNVIFDFGQQKLFYKDIRQFGTLTFTKDPMIILKEIDKIAPDVLDKSTNFEQIKDRIQSSKSMDQILMDQKIVLSGIGNIMKSEILYDAKINPKRKGKDLSEDEWKRVLSSSKKIAKRMLNNLQKNKEAFSGVIKVYEQETDKSGNRIENYLSRDGRRTYWVPSIQK